MKLHLVKQFDNSFKLAFDSDYEKAKKWRPGDVVECEVKKPRNLGHHKKFFALLNLVYQNQEIFSNIEHLRKVLTIKAGYCDEIILPNGEIILDAQSISFAKMDQYQFEDFYGKIINEVVEMFRFKREDIIQNVEQYF